MKKQILIFASFLLMMACSSPEKSAEGENQITIVCTTSIVADAVQHLVPKGVSVIALMGPGIDPHLYKASQGDLEKLQNASVIIYNGLHLEGKMGDILQKLGRTKKVIAMGAGLPTQDLLTHNSNATDPHIWFDLSLWSKAVLYVKGELLLIYPGWSEDLDANYFAYEQDLLATHNWAQSTIATIPEGQRVLVTAHDAFAYFGRAYNIKVKALQGISTASEFGLKDVSDLIDYIVENKVPAVFVESSVPKKSIEAVIEGCRSRGHNVILGGQLYSDALGNLGTKEAFLVGAFKANVNTIYGGLTHQANQN